MTAMSNLEDSIRRMTTRPSRFNSDVLIPFLDNGRDNGADPRPSRILSPRVGPRTHRLPFAIMWGITLLTSLSIALLNFVVVLTIQWLARLKFSAMQMAIRHTGVVWDGIIVLVVISTGYSVVMVCIIELIAPNCGGSGIPENKTYLNGGAMPGLFTKRTLPVRAITNILANASGFPVGREGPMVTMGSNIAFMISRWLAQPYVKEHMEWSEEGSRTLLVDDARLQHATRIACTVGGACAMAAIFNAPFGGLLYMFEEVTSLAWPLELTFHVFVTTMCCSLLSCAMAYLISSDISEFVIYVPFPQDNTWTWNEMPIFIVLSLLSGILTSLHTRGLLAFTRIRQAIKVRFRSRQPFAIIAETAVYAAVCALASSLVSLLGRCPDKADTAAGLEVVQFNCGEGQYNPISSLLLTTSHSALKILYSFHNHGEIHWGSSLLAFVTYGSLNVGLGGLPVPGGAFTATMLMGALFGRSVGALCSEYGYGGSSSGVYAVVGSAAMLCGFKQMTLASVLIVVECVNDISLAPVVMLAVAISMGVNWTMNKHGYDEQVILEKKLPFLEGEPPPELDGVCALQLCDPLPDSAILPPEASVDEVQQAIRDNPQIQYFPIREGNAGPCIGIVTRPHLKAMLESASDLRGGSTRPAGRIKNSGTNCEEAKRIGGATSSSAGSASARDSSRKITNSNSSHQENHASEVAIEQTPAACNTLPLHRVADPTPFVVVEDMPAPRLYALFAKAGERAACVTSVRGELRGVISREGLIKCARDRRLRRGTHSRR